MSEGLCFSFRQRAWEDFAETIPTKQLNSKVLSTNKPASRGGGDDGCARVRAHHGGTPESDIPRRTIRDCTSDPPVLRKRGAAFSRDRRSPTRGTREQSQRFRLGDGAFLRRVHDCHLGGRLLRRVLLRRVSVGRAGAQGIVTVVMVDLAESVSGCTYDS